MEFVSINETHHAAIHQEKAVMELKNCTAEKAKQTMADCILTPEVP